MTEETTTTLTGIVCDANHNLCSVDDCDAGAIGIAFTAPARVQVNMCPEHVRQCLVDEGCLVELTRAPGRDWRCTIYPSGFVRGTVDGRFGNQPSFHGDGKTESEATQKAYVALKTAERKG